jgi:N-acetylmuramoyl-L-alanine amidase
MKFLSVRRVLLHMLLALLFMIASSFQPAATKPYTIRKVVIDAGHGGHDSGCLGMTAKEKDVALAISLKLGKLIEETFPDVKVIYTRKTDVFLELHQRAEIANNAKADLFICIHCNSACYYDKRSKKVKCNQEANGTETWVMGLHKSDANLEVAKRENEVVLMEKDYQKKYDGFDPNSPEANIIFSLYQNTYLDQSLHLASLVQEEIIKSGRESRGVKQAGFLVLYRTFMPGIYVETGFLSNKAEEKFLASSHGQEGIAKSILNAFKAYKNRIETEESTKVSEDAGKETKKETPKDSVPAKDTASHDKIDTTALYHPRNEKPKTDSVVEEKDLPAKPQYYFSVQIVLSQTKLAEGSERFKGVKDVNEEIIDGVYKYSVGHFASFSEATAMQGKMKERGFKDCFIVGYKNGKRIPAAEARKALGQ